MSVLPIFSHTQFLSLLALAVAGIGVWLSVGRAIRAALARTALRGRALAGFGVLCAVFAILLFRPHEDTFIGVDTSCYRHMTHALQAGRPLLGPDAVLLEAPRDIRRAFLLMPDMRWRNTRDRSFEIRSLDSTFSQPFFYVLLPLAASGFDALVPGSASDYFMPLVGWLFVVALLLAGAVFGSGWGIAGAAALLLGTPLPVWFFRGYFPEVLGAILIAGVALQWVLRLGKTLPPSSLFPLGLAICLHPLLVVLALPVALLIWVAGESRRANMLAGACWVLAGTLPLWIMTRWICQPYGRISDWRVLLRNMYVSGEHRMVMIAALLVIAALFCWMLLPDHRRHKIRISALRWVALHRVRAIFITAMAMPCLLALYAPFSAAAVSRGAFELGQGAQWPLGLLAALLAMWIVWRGRPRKVLLLGILVFALPVFLYLKGVELVGLWSQRRLMPWVIMALVSLLPGLAAMRALAGGASRKSALLRIAIALFFVLAAGHNAFFWPAPYLVRYESGADEWIAHLRGQIGKNLAFFDYHSYSFPLAVDGRTRVFGLGEQAQPLLGPVIQWLRERASEETVLVATAYANPGIEDGLRLVPLGEESSTVSRIRSRAALPAEAFTRSVRVEFMRAEPISATDLLAVHKVFDGGPLALRGPWQRNTQRIQSPTGEIVEGQWARAKAGIVGPAPALGERLRIKVQGVCGRVDTNSVATFSLEAPGGERSPPLQLSNEWTEAAIEWAPAIDATNRTAVYHFHFDELYDPSREGLRGYPNDLGALLHRMDIELVSTHTPAPTND